MPIANESGVLKLSNKDRKPGGSRTTNPTRERRKRAKPSDEDQARKQQERDERRAKFESALAGARKSLWDLVVNLHEQFPERTEDWFFQYLTMQPKVTQTQRDITDWNAFISIETEKLNKGT